MSGAYVIDINKADHGSFTDFAVLNHAGLTSWLPHLFRTCNSNGFAISRLIDRYLVAFFDKYLKGKTIDVYLLRIES